MFDDESTADMDDMDMFEEFGEGFESDFDAVSEKAYEKAFDKEDAVREGKDFIEDEEINEEDYEFDSVVGGRDKKPVMSLLNKGKLSRYEMDDLLNQL